MYALEKVRVRIHFTKELFESLEIPIPFAE